MKDIYYESKKDKSYEVFAEEQQEYGGRLHFHRAFELAYITSGEASYFVENESFIAETDCIVFTHCYYRHRGGAEPKHRKYIIAVPENFSRDIAKQFNDSSLPALLDNKEFNRKILPYFEKLVREGEGMPKMLAKGYVNVIFGSLLQQYNSVAVIPKNKNVAIIANILGYIDDHFREQITLESISEQFGYNKTYFSRLFNQHIGMSISNYVNMVRLNKFEMLYGDSNGENITEMIFECGFSSLATFYRVKEFRRKNNY